MQFVRLAMTALAILVGTLSFCHLVIGQGEARAVKTTIQATRFELIDENRRVVAELFTIDGDPQLVLYNRNRKQQPGGQLVIGTNDAGGYIRVRSTDGKSEAATFVNADGRAKNVILSDLPNDQPDEGLRLDWQAP